MPLLRLCYRTFIVIVRIKEQDIYTLKIICIARYIDKSPINREKNNDKFMIYMWQYGSNEIRFNLST